MTPNSIFSDLVIEERPAPSVARIIMNRPEARNAQNVDLLYALDDAFSHAGADTDVRVIILAGADPHFSSGHDLRRSLAMEPAESFRGHSVGGGISEDGGYGYMAREEELYTGLCEKWRNIDKPTIAEVQGHCIAAGLMLAWVCDMIVASDDALFVDPVVAMGVSGVEWFAHPWELGPRKAKELLMTGDPWTAEDARGLGMVNHVVPRSDLTGFVLTLAKKIARQPSFALKAVKRSVNIMIDGQGRKQSQDAAFALHHLCHYHNMQRFGELADPGEQAGGNEKSSGKQEPEET